jgi:hypothetical protein
MSFNMGMPPAHILIAGSSLVSDKAKGLEISLTELIATEITLIQQIIVEELQPGHGAQVRAVYFGEIVGLYLLGWLIRYETA